MASEIVSGEQRKSVGCYRQSHLDGDGSRKMTMRMMVHSSHMWFPLMYCMNYSYGYSHHEESHHHDDALGAITVELHG